MLVENLVGVADRELARMGDYLESANDGVVFIVGGGYMREVAGPDLCPP